MSHRGGKMGEMLPVTEERTKPICPNCHATDLVPIHYGYPSPEMFEQAGLGKIELGGCVIFGDDPEWTCRKCGTKVLSDGNAAPLEPF